MSRSAPISDTFVRPGLTGLRALAAGLVLTHHLSAIAGHRAIHLDLGPLRLDLTLLFTIGWVGVDVFFVLSAFLLTVHLLGREAQRGAAVFERDYLRARILRVVPAYWFQIAFLFAFAWTMGGGPPAWSAYIPVNLVFLQNLHPEFNTINGVYWTLPVEFAFYLLLPSIVRFIARGGDEATTATRLLRAAAVLVSALVVMVAWRRVTYALFEAEGLQRLLWANTQLPGVIDQFCLGVAAAVAFVVLGRPDGTREGRWSLRADLLAVGGLAGLLALMHAMHHSSDQYWAGRAIYYAWHPAAAACIALLALGVAIRGRLTRLLFENRLVLFLGTISYSLYLWHFQVANQVASRLDMKAEGLGTFALWALPPILAVSALSYFLVERPFLRLKEGKRAAGARGVIRP